MSDLQPGDRVRLGGVGDTRRWWVVRAASSRYAVCTQKAPFRPDSERDVRGPINLIGGGYGDGTYSDDECARMLSELEADDIEVTRRNPAPLEILEAVARP